MLIVGGGDSAVDWALGLQGIASELTVIHRRDEFRAHRASVEQMRADAAEGRLTILTPYEVRTLSGTGGTHTAIGTLDALGEERLHRPLLRRQDRQLGVDAGLHVLGQADLAQAPRNRARPLSG